MNICVFEYVCGGGFQGAMPPAGLLQQGKRMLHAALADFAGLPGVKVYTVMEARFAFEALGTIRLLEPEAAWREVWLEQVRACDATLVVAPENGCALEDLCALVHAEGCVSLNCSLEAIRLAADKLEMSRKLQSCGIRAVRTEPWDASKPLPESGVIKPRDGAGCEDAYRLSPVWMAPGLDANQAWVWQPWVEGDAISFSMLMEPGIVEVLAYNSMEVECASGTGQLHVRNIETGGLDGDSGLRAAGQELAGRLQAAVPGLRGYVGVDGIWKDGELSVLEINPRLTLTYADLPRPAAAPPLAACVLRAFGMHEAAA